MSMTAAFGLEPAALRALRRAISGEVIAPGDGGYDSARRVWNGMIERSPTLVVRPAVTADVGIAIAAARDHGLEIAVRGGGHNIAGASTVDGGLVIDLSLMASVHVDAEARRARVEGGALLKGLDTATTAVGLATPTGMVSNTGVGGLTLGGGYGWLARTHGLSCDNLVSATLVTADGNVVRTSDGENSDLLWGLRGAGANFGIVTEFEFRLHPVPPVVATNTTLLSFDDAATVIRTLIDGAADVPDALTFAIATTLGRNEWGIPAEQVGEPVAMVAWGFLGSLQDARRAAAPFIGGRKPYLELPDPVGQTYLAAQSASDTSAAHGQRWYWKSSFVTKLSDAGIAAFLDRGANGGASLAGVEMLQLGGAIARVGEDDTAYGHRNAAFDFIALGKWSDPDLDEVTVADTRRAWSAVAPHAMAGSYINNMGDEGQDRVRAAYGEAKYARLQDLKSRYDPGNVFHRNANIQPRPSASAAAP